MSAFYAQLHIEVCSHTSYTHTLMVQVSKEILCWIRFEQAIMCSSAIMQTTAELKDTPILIREEIRIVIQRCSCGYSLTRTTTTTTSLVPRLISTFLYEKETGYEAKQQQQRRRNKKDCQGTKWLSVLNTLS